MKIGSRLSRAELNLLFLLILSVIGFSEGEKGKKTVETRVTSKNWKTTWTEGDATFFELKIEEKSDEPCRYWRCSLSSCGVKHPNGTKFTLDPKKDANETRIKYHGTTEDTFYSAKGLSGGFCGVAVEDIRLEDEGNWTLTAVMEKNNVTYEGTVRLDVIAIDKVYFKPNRTQVRPGESVTLTMRISKMRENRTFDACLVTAPDGKNYHLSGAKIEGSVQSEHVVNIGRSLQNGECGTKISPIAPEHEGIWELKARISGTSQFAKGQSNITIGIPSFNETTHDVVFADIDEGTSFDCGPKDAIFCSLTHPDGWVDIFDRQCTSPWKKVAYRDFGNWTCSAIVPYSPEEIVSVTSLVLRPKAQKNMEPQITLGVKSNAEEFTLVCRRDRSQSDGERVKACIMVRPDGKKIFLREGVSSLGEMGRYTLTGGGLDEYDCSMSVKQPLKEVDYGNWKCVMNFHYSKKVSGGFINVLKPGLIDVAPEPRAGITHFPASGIATKRDRLTFLCNANRPLDYCWLISPNKDLFFYGKPQTGSKTQAGFKGMGLSLGECHFEINDKKEKHHSGTWTCGMGLRVGNNTIPHEVKTKMTVTAALVMAKNSTIESDLGETVNLECISTTGNTVQFCLFEKPHGVQITIAEGYSSGRYSQYGQFIQGSCGITIRNITEEDFGAWTCIANIKNPDLSPVNDNSAVVRLVKKKKNQ